MVKKTSRDSSHKHRQAKVEKSSTSSPKAKQVKAKGKLVKQSKTADRLKQSIDRVMDMWAERAMREVEAADTNKVLVLKNSLPQYLAQLAKDLSTNVDRTAARELSDKAQSTKLGQRHGKDRAENSEYTIDQLIVEYHILRQVVCDILEEEAILTPVEREVIVCSIEQAVNDAATQYSLSMREFQEKIIHTLAHDLRTPLATAKVSSQMIIKMPNDPVSSANKAERISKSIDRVDKMITELLDASRDQSKSHAVVNLQELDLAMLLKEVTAELNIIYDDRITFKSVEKCMGSWDMEALRRIIENLTSNAFKHGFEQKPVKIFLTETKSSVELKVQNEGEPIPLKDRKSIFDKFKRSSSAEKNVGWGLGLVVVKELVDAHGGKVSIKSSQNTGTSFIVKLPKKSKPRK